jgi:CspA family cold shock protein
VTATTVSPVRETGKVKFFDSKKGFGFIVADNGERDVFISLAALPSGRTSLDPEQQCSYIRKDGKKGPQASDIQLL